MSTNTTSQAPPFCKLPGYTMRMNGFGFSIGPDEWCLRLLWQGVDLDTPAKYFGGLLFCMMIPILNEAFAYFRKWFSKKYLCPCSPCPSLKREKKKKCCCTTTAAATTSSSKNVVDDNNSNGNNNSTTQDDYFSASLLSSATSGSETNSASNSSCFEVFKEEFLFPYIPSLFYGIQLLWAYTAMLLIMTCDSGVFFAVIFGFLIGHAFFNVYLPRREKKLQDLLEKNEADDEDDDDDDDEEGGEQEESLYSSKTRKQHQQGYQPIKQTTTTTRTSVRRSAIDSYGDNDNNKNTNCCSGAERNSTSSCCGDRQYATPQEGTPLLNNCETTAVAIAGNKIISSAFDQASSENNNNTRISNASPNSPAVAKNCPPNCSCDPCECATENCLNREKQPQQQQTSSASASSKKKKKSKQNTNSNNNNNNENEFSHHSPCCGGVSRH